MAVKSILEVDVKDEDFVRFRAMFAEYQKQLAETPGLWGAANAQMSGAKQAFAEIAGAMKAQSTTINELMGKQAAYAAAIEKSSHAWTGMSHATRQVSDNIYGATTSLLRWASMGGALSGLLGAAGLFGLDRVAGEVSSARRSAQGVGATIGEQEAFKSVFGRYVDTDELVGGINQSLTDPQKRFGLIGIGAKQEDINSGDAVRIAAAVLPNLKRLADQTDIGSLESLIRMRQLPLSMESMRRLKGGQPGEIEASETQWESARSYLNIDDKNAKAWQDLSVKLDLLGGQLETGVKNGIVEGARWLGILPPDKDSQKGPDGTTGAEPKAPAEFVLQKAAKWSETGRGDPMLPGESYFAWLYRTSALGKYGNNNPGNLKDQTGFLRFPDQASGIKAMAWQLKRDIDVHHQRTISEIIGGNAEWPGYTATKADFPSYIKAVAERTGIKPDEPLRSDDATISKLVSAMAKQETKTTIAPAAIVTILNNTGGNVVVTTSQLPQ